VSPSASHHRTGGVIHSFAEPRDHIEGDRGGRIKAQARVVISPEAASYSVGKQDNDVCRPQRERNGSWRPYPLAEHAFAELEGFCYRTE
jgi:hypothetical protein